MEPESRPPDGLAAPERALVEVWQRHTYAEFVAKDVEGARAVRDPGTLSQPSRLL
jgi:hypothetical protein